MENPKELVSSLKKVAHANDKETDKLGKLNLNSYQTLDAVENLKSELSPRPKKHLTIKVDYDEEDISAINVIQSFSPLNKLKNGDREILMKARPKRSYNDISAEMSTFSKILKKSCKFINQTLSSNLVSRTGGLIENLTNSIQPINIQSRKLTNDTVSSADSAIFQDEDAENISSKTLSNNSNIKAAYYTEEDQFIKEIDEQYWKYYVTAVDNYYGNYNVYVTNSLMLSTSLPPIEYFSYEIQKRITPIRLPLDKKLMILDLDETLIHADFDYKFTSHDAYLKLAMTDNMESILPINIRPYLKQFLDYSVKHFEIVVFTAACKEYMDTILNYLDPEGKYFRFSFSRESCVVYKKLYLKFIQIFDVPLKDCIIIDNSIFSFSYNLSNGILVTSFYDEKEDEDLLSLIEFLEAAIIKADDCREKIEATFEFTRIKESLKLQGG